MRSALAGVATGFAFMAIGLLASKLPTSGLKGGRLVRIRRGDISDFQWRLNQLAWVIPVVLGLGTFAVGVIVTGYLLVAG